MTRETSHWLNEPDIGSGEKSSGQKEIERDELSLSAADSRSGLQQKTEEKKGTGSGSRVLRSGTHLARITAVEQEDDTWEAQVHVRLTREPEIAETYIPAGIFPTEEEAWAAAEERARRAFSEHEF